MLVNIYMYFRLTLIVSLNIIAWPVAFITSFASQVSVLTVLLTWHRYPKNVKGIPVFKCILLYYERLFLCKR